MSPGHEAGIPISRRAGDHYFALFSSVFLGRLKLLSGEMAAGFAEYRAALEQARAVDLQFGIANVLEYVGEIAL